MEYCGIISETSGKQSVLYDELLRALKDADLAKEWYKIVDLSDGFKEKFGDWKNNPSPLMSLDQFGEPKLLSHNGNYYLKGNKGRVFIHKAKFSKMSVEQVDEVTGQLLYNYRVRNKKSDVNSPNDKLVSSVMKSVEESIVQYREQHKGDEGMLSKIDLIELYKEDFKQEVKDKLFSMGFKEVLEKEEDELTGKLNINESFESNSKDNATANIKLFLSEIPDVELVKDAEGNASLELKVGEYLGGNSFVSFEEIWSTLEPRLADIVGFSQGKTVVDAYDLMLAEIKKLNSIKPWSVTLESKMRDLDTRKKTEFVQAFSKTKLNFLVSNYDADSRRYSVINATRTNSRDSKIRDLWGKNFQEEFLEGNKIAGNKVNALKKLQEKVSSDMNSIISDTDLYGEDIESFMKYVRYLGGTISERDIDQYIEQNEDKMEPVETIYYLYRGLEETLKVINNSEIPFYKNKEFDNPFNNQSAIREFTVVQAMFATEISENNILSNKGKSYWTYSSQGYLSNKINEWKGDKTSLDALAMKTISKNSLWINHLLATETALDGYPEYSGQERIDKSVERVKNLSLGLSSSFKSVGKNDGVGNTEIEYPDAINDSINKMLADKISGGMGSVFSTIVPADKSRKIEIEGFKMFNSGIKYDPFNGLYIPQSTVDVFIGYFEDEYNRMKEVAIELKTLDPSKFVKHYHTGNANGLKSQLFPSLSKESKDPATKDIRDLLYDEKGLPLAGSLTSLTDEQRKVVSTHIKGVLEQIYKDSANSITKAGIIKMVGGNMTNVSLNSELISAYSKEYGSPIPSIIGDFMINGMIGNIEYTKLFSGDPAYYKNMGDLIKRIPATYTDGLQLRLTKEDHINFNQATIAGIEVASSGLDSIISSLKKTGNKDERLIEKGDIIPGSKNIEYPNKYIGLTETGAKIALSYDRIEGFNVGVNTTDAQAWITPNRWRFLLERLGKWTYAHESAFNKMQTGEKMTEEELKASAQPLKGVYFEINDGRPVYLKYSQAVLIPQLIKGTEMEALLEKMTINPLTGKEYGKNEKHLEIHEVITEDGVKVGAVAPTQINVDGKAKLAKDFSLNPVKLSNRGWKLQQDLPTKLLHANMVGSQLQKNILAGLDTTSGDLNYEVDGVSVDGSVILENIHKAVSKLSDIGRKEMTDEFDIRDGRIHNLDAVYDTMIADFKKKGGNTNIINALEKGMPFDAMPQVRDKLQSIFMSMAKKRMVKIETNGGSMIQLSPFGFETFMKDNTDQGITVVSKDFDGKSLKPPRIVNGKFMPGQVFVSQDMFSKLIPDDIDWRNMPLDELVKMIDPAALQLIGYRIPNQGMSSNDSLQIVGILPDGAGDTIIGYDAIPGKTGSDFDIDKMYVMAHNLAFKDGILTKNDSTEKSKAQNDLIDLYNSVLSSPKTYEALMTSIDGEFLKDDINKLFPSEGMGDMQLFSPVDQIKTKFAYLSGKSGVAQTANQLVDHVLNQTQYIRYRGGIGIEGHKTKSGHTLFDREYDINGENRIADTLSAFLNAYVDIAKDPYISRGNHNSMTSNIAFMMIRAGSPLGFVNRFIGQPILKELVEITKNSQGITSEKLYVGEGKDKRRVDAYEYLINKRGLMMNPSRFEGSKKSAQDLTLSDLKNRLSDNPTNSKIMDLRVLEAFKYLTDVAKEFSGSVMASKQDTTAGGGNFVERNIASNKYTQVAENDNIMGFENKFSETMVGTYKTNAVDWIGDVAHNSKLFLSANKNISDTFNQMSYRAGKGELLTSKDYGSTLDRNYYSYIMSGMDLFKNNDKDHEKLFHALPGQILNLKNAGVNNFLLNELEVKNSGGYDFLKIDNKNKPKTYDDAIHRAWMGLYSSPKAEVKKVAVDLARYAFASSGFQKSINEFYSLVPHEILLDYNIEFHVSDAFDKSKDLATDDNFNDQFNRHMADNELIVNRVSSGNTLMYNNTITEAGFLYNPTSAANTIATGEDTYPEFVTLKDADGEPMLYRLEGGILNEHPDTGKKTKFPLYARTYKLGLKARHGRITEYSHGKSKKNSILAENQLHDYTKKFRKDMLNTAKKDPGFINSADLLNSKQKKNISDQHESGEYAIINSVEGFEERLYIDRSGKKSLSSQRITYKQIINEADVDMFKSYLAKSNGKKPKEFFTPNTRFKEFFNTESQKREPMPQNMIWVRQKEGFYDMINRETGETVITDVDLATGKMAVSQDINIVRDNLDDILRDNDINEPDCE